MAASIGSFAPEYAAASSGQIAWRSGESSGPSSSRNCASSSFARIFHSFGFFTSSGGGRKSAEVPVLTAVGLPFVVPFGAVPTPFGAFTSSSFSFPSLSPLSGLGFGPPASLQTKWSKSKRVASIHAASGCCSASMT